MFHWRAVYGIYVGLHSLYFATLKKPRKKAAMEAAFLNKYRRLY